jgi:hypothetical protein
MQARLASWPQGYFVAEYLGRRYGVTNSTQLDGRSRKLYAEELGGTDFVSLNLYLPTSGDPTLRPCEMPVEKVIAFITGAVPVPPRA